MLVESGEPEALSSDWLQKAVAKSKCRDVTAAFGRGTGPTKPCKTLHIPQADHKVTQMNVAF